MAIALQGTRSTFPYVMFAVPPHDHSKCLTPNSTVVSFDEELPNCLAAAQGNLGGAQGRLQAQTQCCKACVGLFVFITIFYRAWHHAALPPECHLPAVLRAMMTHDDS
jgi:hypothetical protein